MWIIRRVQSWTGPLLGAYSMTLLFVSMTVAFMLPPLMVRIVCWPAGIIALVGLVMAFQRAFRETREADEKQKGRSNSK